MDFPRLAAALLPIMVVASFDFGVTWDEKHRHRYGENIWEFFRGLRSRSAFAETGGHLYGGLFDVDLRRARTVGACQPLRPAPRGQRDVRLGRRRVLRPAGRASVRPVVRGAGDGAAGGVAAVLRRLDEQPEGPALCGDDGGGAVLHLDRLAAVAVLSWPTAVKIAVVARAGAEHPRRRAAVSRLPRAAGGRLRRRWTAMHGLAPARGHGGPCWRA